MDDDSIARFGVGKNMVASIRHWATALGIIQDPKDAIIRPTELGVLLFGKNGLDPYLEHPSSLWLMHWQLCSRPEKTTFYWVFNNFCHEMFEREQLSNGLEKLAKEREWTHVAPSTIKRDVDCFILTYVAKNLSSKTVYEDILESPLAEIGLIKPIGRRQGFRLVRGSKPSLGRGVFLYALSRFWDYFAPNANTLSFESIAYEPGSPGRVFLLNENELADRLTEATDYTDGALKWSETAGLKQMIREHRQSNSTILSYLKKDHSDLKELADGFI